MVNNISWGSYWYFLSVLIVLYYSYVLLVYFRPGFCRNLFPAERSPRKVHNHTSEDPLFLSAQTLSNEISAFLEQASYAKLAKEELIYGVQQITKKYPAIYQSTHQQIVDRVVKFEFKDKYAFSISPEEAAQVWLV